MSDWIKCSERMPPGNVEVLVVEVAKTFNGTFTAISIAQWDTDGTYGDDYSWRDREACSLATVTHWMPLPELPKQG